MLTPLVADMNHANPVGHLGDEAGGMAALARAGVVGVIHKARQGVGFRDGAYERRRTLAAHAGLVWGAYDFATHDDVAENVRDFLQTAAPDAAVSLWLDFEDNRASSMTGTQAREFLDRVDQATGRPCGIYGGNRINEQISAARDRRTGLTLGRDDAWWQAHPLWLCQYKTAPALRSTTLAELGKHVTVWAPWTRWFLLQYTGDGVGPLPHVVPGLRDGADLSAFDGPASALRAAWVAKPVAPARATTPALMPTPDVAAAE